VIFHVVFVSADPSPTGIELGMRMCMIVFDDESMMVPMLLGGVIVLFLLYTCCGPAADPNKEKTHSMGSTRELLEKER